MSEPFDLIEAMASVYGLAMPLRRPAVVPDDDERCWDCGHAWDAQCDCSCCHDGLDMLAHDSASCRNPDHYGQCSGATLPIWEGRSL